MIPANAPIWSSSSATTTTTTNEPSRLGSKLETRYAFQQYDDSVGLMPRSDTDLAVDQNAALKGTLLSNLWIQNTFFHVPTTYATMTSSAADLKCIEDSITLTTLESSRDKIRWSPPPSITSIEGLSSYASTFSLDGIDWSGAEVHLSSHARHQKKLISSRWHDGTDQQQQPLLPNPRTLESRDKFAAEFAPSRAPATTYEKCSQYKFLDDVINGESEESRHSLLNVILQNLVTESTDPKNTTMHALAPTGGHPRPGQTIAFAPSEDLLWMEPLGRLQGGKKGSSFSEDARIQELLRDNKAFPPAQESRQTQFRHTAEDKDASQLQYVPGLQEDRDKTSHYPSSLRLSPFQDPGVSSCSPPASSVESSFFAGRPSQGVHAHSAEFFSGVHDTTELDYFLSSASHSAARLSSTPGLQLKSPRHNEGSAAQFGESSPPSSRVPPSANGSTVVLPSTASPIAAPTCDEPSRPQWHPHPRRQGGTESLPKLDLTLNEPQDHLPCDASELTLLYQRADVLLMRLDDTSPSTTPSSPLGPSPQQSFNDGIAAHPLSEHHPETCRPCAFRWTKGCVNGKNCQFCHEWHSRKKKKSMMDQRNLMIIARPSGKIEFLRCTVEEALRRT